MEETPPPSLVTIEQALVLFEITAAEFPDLGTRERLEHKRRELLLIWHPHRYANLTNNPKKYMKMYRQGEAMTKQIQAAYELLVAKLEKKESQ
jgi:hypothetical protein